MMETNLGLINYILSRCTKMSYGRWRLILVLIKYIKVNI